MQLTRRLLLWTSALALAACGAGGGSSGGPIDDGVDRVLAFSKTAGFRHSSIEVGIQALQSLGGANDFEVEATEDAAEFTPQNLARFDAVI